MKKFTQLFVLFYITIQSSCLIAQEAPNWLKDKPKDVKAGFALYKDKGCFLCHGYSGQGSPMSGPSLSASLPYEYIRLNVRQPRNQMPLYLEETISDEQIKKITTFINALPAPTDPDSIKLLKK